METRWLYVTSEDLPKLRDAAKGVCVIPLGSIEKHGLHMPLGADTIQAETLSYLASQQETVCVFPTLPFGDMSCGHPSTPAGTISLPMTTEMLLLEQLCDQIARYGFRKIIIANGHGGNNLMLGAFMQQLGNKKKDYIVTYTDFSLRVFFQICEYIRANGSGSVPELTPEDEQIMLRYYDEKIPTGHGCMMETAMVMGIAPESVKLHRLGIESGKCRHVSDYLKESRIFMRDDGFFEDYPNGYAAEVDPVDCNERIGKAMVRFSADHVAKAFKTLKEDENLLAWHDARQKGW